MRKDFVEELDKIMSKNKDVYLLTADLGFGLFDEIKSKYPTRFINCGASEHAMLDIAVGLSMSGKIPFAYSITPFLLYRAFETIRNYIDHEKHRVILIGAGRDRDYSHDGFSHWAEEDVEIMKHFKNIICEWPETKEDIKSIISKVITAELPYYINLRR